MTGRQNSAGEVRLEQLGEFQNWQSCQLSFDFDGHADFFYSFNQCVIDCG
jgi:hypothetical protein